MTYVVKPKFHHPGTAEEQLGFTRRDYEGKISTLCAGCGHDFDHRVDHRGLLRALDRAASCGEDFRHRLLVEDAGLFPGNSHGFNSVHGRMPSVLTGANLANRDLIYLGVSGDGDSRLDRLRPVRPYHAARRQHGLYRREQRRVRPDQGPVLRDRRPRLEVEARRRQHRQRHRPGRHRAAARRDLRGALVLRRQDAARAPHQGGDRAQGRRLHRRDLALRRLQQPRRLDQELRLRARAQRGGEPARLHHRPRADQRRLRAGQRRAGRAARRLDVRAAQARRRIRRP